MVRRCFAFYRVGRTKLAVFILHRREQCTERTESECRHEESDDALQNQLNRECFTDKKAVERVELGQVNKGVGERFRDEGGNA